MRRALLLTTVVLALTAAPSARACSLCSQWGSSDALTTIAVIAIAVPAVLNASSLTLGAVASAQLTHGLRPARGLLITELVLSLVSGLFDGLYVWTFLQNPQSSPGLTGTFLAGLGLQVGSAIFAALGLAQPSLFLTPIPVNGGAGAAITFRY